MPSLTTAKILLFVALALHPDGHSFFVTSSSETYRFTQESSQGWDVSSKGLPTSEWQTLTDGQLFNVAPSGHDAAVIGDYPWSDNSYLQLSDGNRIEKQGAAGFYIVNPGAPNEKDYTILTSANP